MGQPDRRAHREVEQGPSILSFASSQVTLTERAHPSRHGVSLLSQSRDTPSSRAKDPSPSHTTRRYPRYAEIADPTEVLL